MRRGSFGNTLVKVYFKKLDEYGIRCLRIYLDSLSVYTYSNKRTEWVSRGSEYYEAPLRSMLLHYKYGSMIPLYLNGKVYLKQNVVLRYRITKREQTVLIEDCLGAFQLIKYIDRMEFKDGKSKKKKSNLQDTGSEGSPYVQTSLFGPDFL